MATPGDRAVRIAHLLALAAAVAALQVASGAYAAELSTPDESPHFVTALMIRDYLVSGFRQSPMDFAVGYYLHYPKVAFGSWPPLFHVAQAAVLLVAPVSKTAILVLLAAIGTAVAAMFYDLARRQWGSAVALVLACVLVLTPTSRFLVSRVLADGPVALFDLWAAVYWIRYLNRHQTRDALLFGALAGLSMLTKQNGAALLLLPFITVPLVGQWPLLRRPVFWAASAVAAAIGAPFILYSARIFVGTDVSGSVFSHVTDYGSMLVSDFGYGLWPLALVGAGALVARLLKGPLDGFWATIAALPIVLVGFHVFAPNLPSSRYLYPAFPSMLLLAGLGVDAVARLVVRSEVSVRRVRTGLLAVLAAASYVTMPAALHKPHIGFDYVAELIDRRNDCNHCAILASSQTEREGLFIVEVALRDDRPQRYVLRANKMLSESDWAGGGYRLRYRDTESLLKMLTDIPVKFVVLDDAEVGSLPHHDLLKDTLARHAESWVRIHADDPGMPRGITVYENRNAADVTGRIEVDMTNSLGQSIGNSQ